MIFMSTEEDWHGSLNGYNWHKCRCIECCQAAKDYARDYRLRKKAERKAYLAANREHVAKRSKNYYEKHKADIRVKQNAYAISYRKANPEKGRAAVSRRRQRISVAMDDLDRLLSSEYRKAIAKDLCFYCSFSGEQDDHFFSLASGGTDHWWNLVRSCRACNQSKSFHCGTWFILRSLV